MPLILRITFFYVGSSLLAPLRSAEREINRVHGLDLRIAAHNFGASFDDDEWEEIENDLRRADVVFVIHVMDGENATRLAPLLDRFRGDHRAVVVINCMPELMKRTRMGRLSFARLPRLSRKDPKQPGEKRESATRRPGNRESPKFNDASQA